METDTCDLGDLRNAIIPPTCINTNGKDDDVSAWTISKLPEGCEPLIVFINRKSGGGMGEFVIRRLNTILNPSQVFDLSKGGPKPAYIFLSPHPTSVLLVLILILQVENARGVWGFSVSHIGVRR